MVGLGWSLIDRITPDAGHLLWRGHLVQSWQFSRSMGGEYGARSVWRNGDVPDVRVDRAHRDTFLSSGSTGLSHVVYHTKTEKRES